MNMTRYEMETIINYNQAEKTASIYTCDRSLMRKLDKLCSESEEITVEKEDEFSKTYILPKKWVKVRKTRQLSEEEREKLASRMRAIREGEDTDEMDEESDD